MNPNHDPNSGEFSSGPGGKSNGHNAGVGNREIKKHITKQHQLSDRAKLIGRIALGTLAAVGVATAYGAYGIHQENKRNEKLYDKINKILRKAADKGVSSHERKTFQSKAETLIKKHKFNPNLADKFK